jgi:predicted nucleic acid-binding protein
LILVADTSGLLAAFDASEAEHERAREVMSSESLLILPFVLAELDHLIFREFGFDATVSAVSAVTDRVSDGDYELAAVKNEDVTRALGVRIQYASLELDLADAVGVVLADRYRTNRIFTLDQRDFRAIKPLTKGFDAFTILPADL